MPNMNYDKTIREPYDPPYWCPVSGAWTDPPIMKDSRNAAKHTRTHALGRHGEALCGKRSPLWFHRQGDMPTCNDCLSHVTQTGREE